MPKLGNICISACVCIRILYICSFFREILIEESNVQRVDPPVTVRKAVYTELVHDRSLVCRSVVTFMVSSMT